jgi:hypothetical protein
MPERRIDDGLNVVITNVNPALDQRVPFGAEDNGLSAPRADPKRMYSFTSGTTDPGAVRWFAPSAEFGGTRRG